MSDGTSASVTVTSLRAARAARERLARAGFARNSVTIERHGDEFDVYVTTKQENWEKAQNLLEGHPLTDDLRGAGSQAVDALRENRPLALGLAALAGFMIFTLTKRR